ncbi:MAG: pilus assembly protein N-terminal domain-containing protein [Myxococcota bacterium]
MPKLMRLGIALSVLLLTSLTVVAAFPSQARAQAPDKEFTIAIGETLTFDGRGIRTVTIGLDEIAAVKTTSGGRELLVTGKKPGVTTINIFASGGQRTLLIRVVPVNPTALAQEARAILGDQSGVDVRVVKGRVLLEGEVASSVFKDKITKLTELYPNQILNFTTFREAFVEGARMVALDIYFIQLAVSDRDQVGVQWGQFIGGNYTFGTGDVPLYYEQQSLQPGVLPGEGANNNKLSFPGALTGGQGLNSYWSLVGQLNVALDFLVEHGLIKTIQHGVIVTEAGREAMYHTGGTLLIGVSSLGSSSIVEKPYGLEVKIKPVLDFEDNVKLEIDMQYSELDNANGVGELPALRNTDVKTVVNMKEGQSVLVSTQDNIISTSNESGWFLLSRVPILGWLFKARNKRAEMLDNAMFVTPRVYEPGGSTHKTLIRGSFEGLLDAGADPEDLPDIMEREGGGAISNTPSGETDGNGDEEGSTGNSSEMLIE